MTSKLVVRMAALAASLIALAPTVRADDGAWKVGSSYVIRFKHLDLSQPTDRQALLVQVERSALKLCEGERPRVRRDSCASSAISSALNASPARVRLAVQMAQTERDGRQQAQR